MGVGGKAQGQRGDLKFQKRRITFGREGPGRRRNLLREGVRGLNRRDGARNERRALPVGWGVCPRRRSPRWEAISLEDHGRIRSLTRKSLPPKKRTVPSRHDARRK